MKNFKDLDKQSGKCVKRQMLKIEIGYGARYVNVQAYSRSLWSE